MKIFEESKNLKSAIKKLKTKELTIGFVPTMGALHAGHISLIKSCKSQTDITICSIFVNPTQFNDKTDFEKYPATLENDIHLLEKAGCNILFIPSVEEMYPKGFANSNKINFSFLANTLEGEHRPGHFDGMAQIVEKLLTIVQPDFLFMGLKDFQQQLIVSKLIQVRKLGTKLIAIDTKREKDGLAMSSRNVRLDKKNRTLAAEISKTLKWVKSKIKLVKNVDDLMAIQKKGLNKLSSYKEFEVEYFEIRNAKTLKRPRNLTEKMVVLVAAKIGGVRLIDNMLVN